MRHVHLVGSVPLKNAREVFETVSGGSAEAQTRSRWRNRRAVRLDHLAGAGFRRKSGTGKVRRVFSHSCDRYRTHPLQTQARGKCR